MTYDEMIRSLEELNTAQGVAITATPCAVIFSTS